MPVIKKKGEKNVPGINSGSLPDIIFTLLFFFMVTTTMREVEMKVTTELAGATEIQKMEKKSLVSFIYVGPPLGNYSVKWGNRPRIQLNGDYSDVNQILAYIASEKDKVSEKDRPAMTTSLKIDKNVRMGIVTPIKEKLREAHALKICYVAQKVMSY